MHKEYKMKHLTKVSKADSLDDVLADILREISPDLANSKCKDGFAIGDECIR